VRDQLRGVIPAHLPDLRCAPLVPLGEGTDHVAYLVGERLVVRLGEDAADVQREARLLTEVAALSPLPVPQPVLVAPEEGCLAYVKLPGVPLLEIPEARRSPHAPAIAAELGRLLRELHAADPTRMAELVDRDQLAFAEWLDEAAERYAAVVETIPPAHRRAIAAFLRARPPDPPPRLTFSHNDLGIEHVLVDVARWTVTGILDWSDAALADPARDFGVLYRDLGPAALQAALQAYGPAADAGLRHRAAFHARCALLEDLAFGLARDRAPYIDKSLAGLAWLFPADA
jgi:aminoglycoside phosphotransferase (APT) family kinase protein